MKQITLSLLALAVISGSTLPSALARDVTPTQPKQIKSLEVRNSGKDGEIQVSFIYHRYPGDAGEFLGPKKSYPISALRELRTSEYLDVAYSLLGDAGMIAVTIFTGGSLEALIATAAGSCGGACIPLIGATTGLVGGITIDHYVDALNPFVQYHQANTLRDEVLLDKAVYLKTDEEIENFVKRLSQALSNLPKEHVE